VAIGDGLHTDIAGANRAGIDSIFVAGGLHAAELVQGDVPDAERIEAACTAAGVRASAAMAELRW
jgi:ribonucleotide monophosphatase NagD (HAD superfamily)